MALHVLFTADTRFREARGLAIDRRPFASVAVQDEALVANWNAAAADATVWHLGDFGPGTTAEIDALLARLNGTKHLILGNNDPEHPHRRRLGLRRALSRALGLLLWRKLAPGEKRLLVLCRYAFRSWNQMGKGAINLHGHSHGRLKPQARQLDVDVDAQNFAPLILDAVMTKTIRRCR